MKNTKLKLKNLKVISFTTSTDDFNAKTLIAGAKPIGTGSEWISCPKNDCDLESKKKCY